MRAPKPKALIPFSPPVTFIQTLEACFSQAAAWRGELFRFTDLEFANLRDLLTGEGSKQAGGRWNGRGAFPALYFSLEPETALAEVLAHRRSQMIPDTEVTPIALTACRAELQHILDLTDPRILEALSISPGRLLEPWRSDQEAGREAFTQGVGRLAQETGFQALLTSSAARPHGRNLVVFPRRIAPGQVVIVNPEKLPKRRRTRSHTAR